MQAWEGKWLMSFRRLRRPVLKKVEEEVSRMEEAGERGQPEGRRPEEGVGRT